MSLWIKLYVYRLLQRPRCEYDVVVGKNTLAPTSHSACLFCFFERIFTDQDSKNFSSTVRETTQMPIVPSPAPVSLTVRQGMGALCFAQKGSLYLCSPSFVFPYLGSFPIIHQPFLCGSRVLCASSGLSNDILGT